jgi:hypothetical protein
MVRKRNVVHASDQSSSSDLTFYTANDTTNNIANTSVVSAASLDGKYVTPRQLYEMKKQKNETV